MVEIVDELKAKLVEIDGKMEELRREIVVLEAQKSAFETVIRVYDPSFELAAPPSKARRLLHQTVQRRGEPAREGRFQARAASLPRSASFANRSAIPAVVVGRSERRRMSSTIWRLFLPLRSSVTRPLSVSRDEAVVRQ